MEDPVDVTAQEGLIALFRQHVEAYPVAERLDLKVQSVEKGPDGFAVATSDDRDAADTANAFEPRLHPFVGELGDVPDLGSQRCPRRLLVKP